MISAHMEVHVKNGNFSTKNVYQYSHIIIANGAINYGISTTCDITHSSEMGVRL
jgi:hypothetical protein